MKTISLWQPWASLIALGAKTIETRSWNTSYRGPLAIHAAKTDREIPIRIGPYTSGRWANDLRHAEPCDCDLDEEQAGERCLANSDWYHALLNDEGAHGWSVACRLPLGAVIATCRLADCVPTDYRSTCIDVGQQGWAIQAIGRLPLIDPDQYPYGDFTPGRFMWLLADIEPLAEPVPARGRQQLWDWQPASCVRCGLDDILDDSTGLCINCHVMKALTR